MVHSTATGFEGRNVNIVASRMCPEIFHYIQSAMVVAGTGRAKKGVDCACAFN